MDPIMQAVYFGRADELIKEKNPNEEEQLPATQNDFLVARTNYEQDPTEEHGQAFVNAMRRSGMHDEADEFARTHLKAKPKFTIQPGF